MALLAVPALKADGFEKNDCVFERVDDLGILSIATPLKGGAKLDGALDKAFGLKRPKIGSSAKGKAKFRALGLQEDQCFLLFDYKDALAAAKHIKAVGAAGYCTDQSDAWVVVRAKGARIHEALERICKIDLDENRFPLGAVARSSMEHLGAMIFHEAKGQFLLFSARSSAESFWHALTASAENLD